MPKTMTVVAAIVAGASVLALHGSALPQTGSAKTPTQADLNFCNREAELSSSAGSASPRGGRSASASRSMQGSTGIGSSMSTSVGAGAAAGGSTSGGSTLDGGNSVTGSPPSIVGDAFQRGVTSAGSADLTYQQAYRDCLKQKGF